MENQRIQELMLKARTGSLSTAEKSELANLAKPSTNLSGADAIGTKQPVVSEKEFNKAAEEEMSRAPSTIVTAKSNQMGSIPKVVELPNKKMDVYQQNVEAARLNKATVPTKSNEGKLPPFPIMEKAEPVAETPVAKSTPVKQVTAPVVAKAEEAPKSADTATPLLDGDKPVKDKKTFGEILKELAVKYGVPILEVIEAVGKYRGGITTPTVIEKKYAAQLDKEQADYAAKLAALREAAEEERQNKMLQKQQAFTARENELNRIADKEARGQELSARERLAKMEMEGKKTSGSNVSIPLIPQ